jgi:ribosomal protein S18 acetylase RimI-like enzyme
MDIIEFGKLTAKQKLQAVELFLEGFGSFMTFSKDEEKKKSLFLEIFDPTLFLCCLENDEVLGLLGLGTNKVRPINFKKEICQKHFGSFKGAIISRQMNAIFQKPAVSSERELYVDTIVVDPKSRKKGIGTILMEKATAFGDYDTLVLEVFSKNQTAINFYKKNGFIVRKERRFSFMSLFGSGHPIVMTKPINPQE